MLLFRGMVFFNIQITVTLAGGDRKWFGAPVVNQNQGIVNVFFFVKQAFGLIT
jgi:hypothetical protein